MGGKHNMKLDHVVEDWLVVKKRWEVSWQHGPYDRPLIQVRAPRDGVAPSEDLDVNPPTRSDRCGRLAATLLGGLVND